MSNMKKVYSTEILANAWNIRNVLQQHDIEAEVRNENLFSVSGEVPFIECMPEVWVQTLYAARAEQIIAQTQGPAEEEGPDWHCLACGESNASNFAVCWNCEGSEAKATSTEQS